MEDINSYKCSRCGYETKSKSNLFVHFRRKKPCNPILSDISYEELHRFLSTPKHENKCALCLKQFANRHSLSRHRKKCVIKEVSQDSDNEVQKQIKEMKNLMEKQQDQINSLLHEKNINTINIQQNIVVNEASKKIKEFGCENVNAIPSFFISNCFLDLKYRDLLENLHFDPDYPENNNIRIKSTKRSLVEIYVNNHWMVFPLSDGLMRLIDQGTRIFKEHARKNKSQILEHDMEEDEYYKHVKELHRYDELDSNKKLFAKTSADLQAMLETVKNYDGKLSYTKMERITESKESECETDED